MPETEDTSGFYSLEGGAALCHAPNFVHSPQFYIDRGRKDTYTYPVGGWYWFDSREQARVFFGLPPEPPPEENSDTQFYSDPNGGI